MKLNFSKIADQFEKFLVEDNMSYFVDRTTWFMEEHLSEDMTEDEAIDYLEQNFLFDKKKSKHDVLIAADVLRAVRMVKYFRH